MLEDFVVFFYEILAGAFQLSNCFVVKKVSLAFPRQLRKLYENRCKQTCQSKFRWQSTWQSLCKYFLIEMRESSELYKQAPAPCHAVTMQVK